MSNTQIECPLCHTILKKESDHQFYKCNKCGIVKNAAYATLEYSDDYYVKDYQIQYGKTYEEDFDSIYTVSCQRIKRIDNLLTDKKKLSILDVGCALGFFLKAAFDRGFKKVEGIEISSYAANYIINKFAYKVHQIPFEEFEPKGKYDIVTAWFTIEHSKEPLSIIKKMFNLVDEGGVLAFSLPSTFGPMYLFKRKIWFQTHPVDHSYDYAPKNLRKFLKKLGAKKIIIFPSSYHPERVFSSRSKIYPLFKTLYRFFADCFAFGDTMEVYVRK